HLRPQLLRGRRAGRRRHVAGGRQAGARAVHALRRARLGRLRPGASRRRACRHRRERKAHPLRVPRLPPPLDAPPTPPPAPPPAAAWSPATRRAPGRWSGGASRRGASHAVPMVGYLKGAPLRSPLDLSFAFASEQTIDELAFMAKIDPLEFRRNNIGDARW